MRIDRQRISQFAVLIALCGATAGCQSMNAQAPAQQASPSAVGVEPDIRRILAGGGLDPSAPASAKQQTAQAGAPAAPLAQGLVPVAPPTAASLAYAQQPGGAPPSVAGTGPQALTGSVVPQVPALAAAVPNPAASSKGRRKGKSFEPVPGLPIVAGTPVPAVPTTPVSSIPLAAANGVGVTPVQVPGLPAGLLPSGPSLPAALTTSIVPAPLAPRVVDITGPSAVKVRSAGHEDAAPKQTDAAAPAAPAAPEPYVPKIRRF